jgi:competence protein ComEC
LKFWGLLIAGAVSPFLFASAVPDHLAWVFLLLTGLLALLAPSVRLYCICPAFFLLTSLAIDERLGERLPLSENKTVRVIEGVVSSLPDATPERTSFIFEPLRRDDTLPSRMRVNWFAERSRKAVPGNSIPEIRAGEHWRLQLELRAPRSRVNFHGTDAERWYFTDGIDALAYVQAGDNKRLSGPAFHNLQHLRESLLQRLQQAAGQAPSFRILAALAIADRRGLLAQDKAVLSATGTGHLLAISGLHIGLAAAMGFYFGRLCLLLPPARLRQQWAVAIPWAMAWLAALCYAALAGFGISTQRALIMLTVATLVTLCRRNVQPLLAWLIAMALVLIVDPFAPLRAGFWFSFVAVLVLLFLFLPRHGVMVFWKKMLLAQLGISLVMAPLGMYWFQQASLPGLLANLLAIPVVSFVVVPLVLAGMLLLYLPLPLAEWALKGASYASEWLLVYLQWLAQLQPASFGSTSEPALPTVVMAMLARPCCCCQGARLRGFRAFC